MVKIIKELKPFTVLVLIIVGLLFAQAMADLALPDYMSNIVNVGIQQNGIENAVPQVIRAEKMEKLKILLDEEEKNIVDKNYKLIDKSNLTEQEFKDYSKKYKALENESLYILSDIVSEEDMEKMNSFLSKSILILYGIEEGVPQGIGAQEGEIESPFKDLPEGTDPFMVLENLPKEQFDAMKEKMNKQFENIPDSMIIQSAIKFIKSEYEEIGRDISKLQSRYILSTGGKMLLIALGGMVASIFVGFLAARVSASLGRNLRDNIFKKVIYFSNAESDKYSTASLITRSTNDIQQVQMFIILLLRIVFYAPILGIGGIVKVLETNTSMAWIIAVGVVAILALVIVLFSMAVPKFKVIQKLVDKVNLVIREALNGIMVIRAFNTQKYEEDRFDEVNKDLTKTHLFVSRLMAIMMPTMMLIMNCIILLIVWIGAHEINSGAIQVGDMMAFMQYTMQIIMSFLMISAISIILPRASVSAQRIVEVLDEEVTIKNPENPKKITGDVKGTIEFKNVSFKYPGAEEYVLKDISFIANAGETTAFIGSTGSGKSTLINLIPRFYDPTEGQILLDGIDIRDMELKDLRERIGYVPQKGVLFTGTIESNLKYGKNFDATREDVLKAIEIAQAKEIVDEKEKGILHEIAQGGTNVSGGQKQRLSIARTLVKKPEIFIFDDSFSALDFKTDAALRSAIEREIKDRTILIVAQRISTIMNADKIVVLDQGEIVGIGTHKELLKKCDIYRQIAMSQLSEEELQ
ncbi:ATP-binding cassette subfamily B protein [Keratinibaculum paraultunense]|uniref:ATP-binding cassette subfamily B protein n=1 Tax=Keratinibaculum paraultunense TaxID=1278232 RepID=A0A4R3KR92_9FIRM|nr:ABC transporter transmembrane domain-containing protein [Keratinibaculum paraultunense]QQY78841.1 ATP-binding cassette domain-containing protein [Keratinibaculum paraultunense]TCS87448.1 ATP-binding cassette subfamily B protein [Keratinibaculum paraultunense]